MNYVESIKQHPLTNFWNTLSLINLSRTSKKLVKKNIVQLDHLRKVVDDLDLQIAEWNKQMAEGSLMDLSHHIEIFTALKNFYEDNGKLLMIELDVTESFSHILLLRNDWEYRYYARRLFTLMHETRDALMASLGTHRKQMMTIAPTAFPQYEKTKKSLDVFFNLNGATIKSIRNKTDAHKGEPFRDQIICIEQIDVKTSFELIHEYQVLLANLSMALTIILSEISNTLYTLL